MPFFSNMSYAQKLVTGSSGGLFILFDAVFERNPLTSTYWGICKRGTCEVKMNEGEDFIFISDGNPNEVIKKFLDENRFIFEQEIWEYPWSPQGNEEIKIFGSFDSVLEFVLSQSAPEYIFYPSGKVNCWFAISKDKSVVFGIEYSGQDLVELVNLAKSYDGKFGYISLEVFPDLEGMKAYVEGEKYPDLIGYKDQDFPFYGDRELFPKKQKLGTPSFLHTCFIPVPLYALAVN